MFTGIVRERATVESFDRGRLVVATALDPAIGDSVAVDGVCLPVTAHSNGSVTSDAMPAPLAGAKPFDAEVNLETALPAADPLGGHYVQGHVDGTGRIRAIEPEEDSRRVTIETPPDILRYCVEKGS